MGLTQDINISIRGAQMVIEAIHDLGYSKPFRSHLIEKEILNEFDQEGILELGCSEIQLHHGYNYNLVSYQVISPSLLKVILRYDKSNNNTSYIN
jgi:hypothetical protein